MNNSKRKIIKKASVLAMVATMTAWDKPTIKAISLPAHAQTTVLPVDVESYVVHISSTKNPDGETVSSVSAPDKISYAVACGA